MVGNYATKEMSAGTVIVESDLSARDISGHSSEDGPTSELHSALSRMVESK